MSERILEAVPTMVQGESKTFDSLLKVELTKNVNVNSVVFDYLGRTWFLDVKEIKEREGMEESYRKALLAEKPDWDSNEEYNLNLEMDHWETNWQIPQEVSLQIKQGLEAANRKLKHFTEGVCKALVLDFQFDQLFDDYLYAELTGQTEKHSGDYPHVNRLYILTNYSTRSGHPRLIFRIW
jgi:hypothetical protein